MNYETEMKNYMVGKKNDEEFRSWCKSHGLSYSEVVDFLIHQHLNVAPRPVEYLNGITYNKGQLDVGRFIRVLSAIYPDVDFSEYDFDTYGYDEPKGFIECVTKSRYSVAGVEKNVPDYEKLRS